MDKTRQDMLQVSRSGFTATPVDEDAVYPYHDLDSITLTVPMISDIHKTLLNGVRPDAGDFRKAEAKTIDRPYF